MVSQAYNASYSKRGDKRNCKYEVSLGNLGTACLEVGEGRKEDRDRMKGRKEGRKEGEERSGKGGMQAWSSVVQSLSSTYQALGLSRSMREGRGRRRGGEKGGRKRNGWRQG